MLDSFCIYFLFSSSAKVAKFGSQQNSVAFSKKMPSCRKAAIFPYQTFSPGPLWHPQVCNSLPHSSQNWCIEGHAPLNPKISIKQFFQGTFQASFSWKGQWELRPWRITLTRFVGFPWIAEHVVFLCQRNLRLQIRH